jgi:hypothetical protein
MRTRGPISSSIAPIWRRSAALSADERARRLGWGLAAATYDDALWFFVPCLVVLRRGVPTSCRGPPPPRRATPRRPATPSAGRGRPTQRAVRPPRRSDHVVRPRRRVTDVDHLSHERRARRAPPGDLRLGDSGRAAWSGSPGDRVRAAG